MNKAIKKCRLKRQVVIGFEVYQRKESVVLLSSAVIHTRHLTMVTINESGMTFGPFLDDQVYQIEKAEAYTHLGEGVKVVEFIYKQKTEKFFFVEAKNSSPMPKGEEFKKFIREISDKFVHSFDLWLSLNLKRRKDDVASKNVLDAKINKQIFRFILVIKGHEKSWLPPISEALRREMMAEIKIWKHEIIVINDQQAKQRGLIM